MERDFKGIRIPKEIRLDEDLNIMMKVLLVEIDSLENEDWCFASNSYFSKFFWISETQISVYIKKLKELWYIEEVWFDWRKRYLRSRVKEKLKSDSKKSFGQPLRKVKGRLKEKLKHNNINNNILLSNDNNSEAENLKETPLLSVVEDIKEKEKSSAKKEKESFWNVEINEFIEKIKEKCNSLWIMYDKTKEREFSRHILTAREFWENSTKCWMTRTDFSINILIASIKIWYFKWPCNWPMKIYQNYADVYNRTVMKRWSGGWIVHIDV